MKHIVILLVALAAAEITCAQARFPYDSVSHQVVYNQTLKLNPKVNPDDVYITVMAWFGDSHKFTHKNAIVPLDTMITKKKNKNKADAEDQFDNPRPLQMQDPAGDKLQGLGIIRYYGNANSIKLLYIKYDIGVKIETNQVVVSVSNIRYFHYNASSYKQVPLYNFMGGKPCEEVGTLESLIACENFHEEFKALAVYCNKEIAGHTSDLKSILKQKKYLNDGSAPAKASTKPSVKPAAKAPAKTAPKAPIKK